MSEEPDTVKEDQAIPEANGISTTFIGPQLPGSQLKQILSPGLESERDDDAISELKDVWKSELSTKGIADRLRSSARRISTVIDSGPAPTKIAIDAQLIDTAAQVQKVTTDTLAMQTEEEKEPVSNTMETDEATAEEPFTLISQIHFEEKTKLIEVGRWRTTKKSQYTRGAIWSPDGTCLLTAINQLGILVFDTPTDLYSIESSLDESRLVQKLEPAFQIRDSKESNVYDMVWYPGMTSTEPATCCFLVTRQHEPIHCYDGFDGSLRCTYRAYNSVDECEAALSVCFSNDGAHIFGGFKKSIKTFLTERPGRDFETIKTKSAVSAISATEHIVVAGSWNTTISMYDQRSQSTEAPIITMNGQHKGGITHLRMLGDNWLVSGARKDKKLILWDLRNALARPYCVLNREVATNQRIYFDISIEGKWLVSGNTNGDLRAWNLFETFADPEATVNEYTYPLYEDCCNGVSVHPSLPLVASSSGQFRFDDDDRRHNFVTMWWLQQPQD